MALETGNPVAGAVKIGMVAIGDLTWAFCDILIGCLRGTRRQVW
ncbi:hypothetical protein [Mycobacterium sp. 1274761.0]|nr:hypothetical protein [Mycobacterium sp. 1274761.0]